jgi:FAD/FMN-containing dehydrogenase
MEMKKYWTIRRESFNLLRKHIKGKRTAPFIDDFIIKVEQLPEFLPKLNHILAKYNLNYTIAGHVGDANFHIIPLMDLRDIRSSEIIRNLSEEVYNLVLSYRGSITAEHNDGLIRSSYLKKMYGEKVYKLFEETKKIFDPQNIFNPGKKVNSDLNYAFKHLVKS